MQRYRTALWWTVCWAVLVNIALVVAGFVVLFFWPGLVQGVYPIRAVLIGGLTSVTAAVLAIRERGGVEGKWKLTTSPAGVDVASVVGDVRVPWAALAGCEVRRFGPLSQVRLSLTDRSALELLDRDELDRDQLSERQLKALFGADPDGRTIALRVAPLSPSVEELTQRLRLR